MKYKRIYFYHIRKTGGTSLNQMFFQLFDPNTEVNFEQIRSSDDKRIKISNNYFVSSNKNYLEAGDYFYGYSHFSFQDLNIPEGTYKFTIFRNPIDRIISHYRMVLDYSKNNVNLYWVDIEKKWLGNSFADFIEALPKERLLSQLWMFSKNYDIEEALINVSSLDLFFTLENFEKGIFELSKSLEFFLSPLHKRKNTIEVEISQHDIERLKNLLLPEYQFLKELNILYDT